MEKGEKKANDNNEIVYEAFNILQTGVNCIGKAG